MSAAIPFRSGHEENHLANADARPAAFLFNPAAGPHELLAASVSRMQSLRRALDAWALVGRDSAVDAVELATMLLPWAEEIELINAQLEAKLRGLAAEGVVT